MVLSSFYSPFSFMCHTVKNVFIFYYYFLKKKKRLYWPRTYLIHNQTGIPADVLIPVTFLHKQHMQLQYGGREKTGKIIQLATAIRSVLSQSYYSSKFHTETHMINSSSTTTSKPGNC